jgi:hypothetical protein
MWTKKTLAAIEEWTDEKKRPDAKQALIDEGLFYVVVQLESAGTAAEINEAIRGIMDERVRKTSRIPSDGSVSSVAAIMGRRGGRSKSDAKVRAARENGKNGGRPKKAVR